MTIIFEFFRSNLALISTLASVPALLVGLINWLRLRKVRRFVREHQELMLRWADLAAGLDTLDKVAEPSRPSEDWAKVAHHFRDDLNRLRTALGNMFRVIGRGNSNFLLSEARRLYELGWYKEAANTYDRVLQRDARLESLDPHHKRICYSEWQLCCLAIFDFADATRVAEKSREAGFEGCIAPDEVMKWRFRHVVRARLRGFERKLAKSLFRGGNGPSFPGYSK